DRSRTEPSKPRTDRSRACPQPVSTPRHPGHESCPPTSRRSTAAASPPTVTMTPPRVIARPSRSTPARDDGRVVAFQDMLTVPPETNEDNHEMVALNPSSPSMPPAYPHMLILSAVEQFNATGDPAQVAKWGRAQRDRAPARVRQVHHRQGRIDKEGAARRRIE